MRDVPVDTFLSAYSPEIRDAAEPLRQIVRRTVPDALERVRPGWRLIGYELPLGRRRRYFAYVAPEPGHVHLGFEYGAWMADPGRLLEGERLRLRRVRYLTIRPGEPIRERDVSALVREGARVAVMPPGQRMSLELDEEWRPRREADEGRA